ncbi:MAG: class II glutamine amidotransferase [Bacteroidetes bacterium]|jgi:glutamine amidotransferase|nr:class II glutamine amidotransferase [Bacteroidota bacterium]
MCRLYGLQATHPTTAACELLDAQNALIRQSREDARGLSNPHGWGVGHIVDSATGCARQVKPAGESADYRERALAAEGTTVLAHVRRATVGSPDPMNTHPFRHGNALLIHNGHVPAFDAVRPHLLERIEADRERLIQGTTDSEHVLALLLQLRDERPEASLRDVTQSAIQHLQAWVRDARSGATVEPTDADLQALPHEDLVDILGLNLLWTDGTVLAGSRLNRTLWLLERDTVPTCSICGQEHAHPPGDASYRASVLASERITDEGWSAVPNGTVFTVDRRAGPTVEDLSGR